MIQDSKLGGPWSSRKLLSSLLVIATLTCTAVSGVGIYLIPSFRSTRVQSVAQKPVLPKVKTVTALGRVAPQGEVIKLSAPTTFEGSRVEKLLIKEGDKVKAGQMVAILDSYVRLQAAVQEAQQQVKVAQAKLAQTQAGAKLGEIAAQEAEIGRLEAERKGNINSQQATVARLEAQVRNAEAEDRRYEALYKEGAISASQRDNVRLTLETNHKSLQEAQAELSRRQKASQQQLIEAQATLERIAEVRPVDVEVVEAEVERARAAVNQAKANLTQAYVLTPVSGEILDIHTRVGELVSSEKNIADVAQNNQMYVVAEVYQSEINKVALGQQVQIYSDSLPGELQGTVERIGSQVRRQNVINTDPSSNIDARIVEVHVQLDNLSSQKAAKFTDLQVRTVFLL